MKSGTRKTGQGRRDFLKTVAAGAGVALFPNLLPSTAWGQNAPSNRLTLGMVGMGKMMNGHAGTFLPQREVQIVAMCDVESIRLDLQKRRAEMSYAEQFGKGTYKCIDTCKDFREVAARPDIDAVIIATPDHWHTLVSIEMLRNRKDVYCEKPMTLTINEGKALVETVRRYNRVFQTGSQQRSEEGFRHACEMVQSGRIGEVKEVYISVGGPPTECYLPPQPVPEGLDWDMWLGPAPWRPFNADIAPPLSMGAPITESSQLDAAYGTWANFRAYRDYSGGGMTDWGAHHFDIAQWGLGMDGSGPVEITPPNGADVQALTYRYANGVVMYHKGYEKSQKAGVTFVGTEGVVMVNRSYLETDPVGLKDAPIGSDDVKLYQSPGHQRDWLAAIRTRTKPICDVEVGHRSASVCHIGNIAYQLGRTLHWDPVREEFANDPEANQLMQRPMRAPWRLA